MTIRKYCCMVLAAGLLLWNAERSGAQVNPQDSLALVALYDSTGGDSVWIDNSNWLSGPVQGWFGVTVSADRVTELDLSSNNLTGPLPDATGDLTQLTRLDLFDNNLSGPLPASVGNLSALSTLIASGNGLSGPLPDTLGALAGLQILVLNNNAFSGPIPPALGSLSNLFFLDLSFNPISGEIPVELSNLGNLLFLGLDNNELTGAIPRELGDLLNLEELFLSNNQFTGGIPEEFVVLPNLEFLFLSGNDFIDLPDFSSSGSLQFFFVEDNRLTFEDLEANVPIANFVYAPQQEVGFAADTTIGLGDTLLLSVSVGGTSNLYQWLLDDVPISGEIDDSLWLSGAQLSDSGTYRCEITNTIATALTVNSAPVQVHVFDPVSIDDGPAAPARFTLDQNYPNPFNPSTTIRYELPATVRVRLAVYNVMGQEVGVLVDAWQAPGKHAVTWAGRNNFGIQVSSGLYVYRLEAGTARLTRKMLLVR